MSFHYVDLSANQTAYIPRRKTKLHVMVPVVSCKVVLNDPEYKLSLVTTSSVMVRSWGVSCLFLCRSQWLPSVWPVPSPVQRPTVWQVQRRLLQNIQILCSMWLQWECRSSRPRPALSAWYWQLPQLHQQHHRVPVPALRTWIHRGRPSA